MLPPQVLDGGQPLGGGPRSPIGPRVIPRGVRGGRCQAQGAPQAEFHDASIDRTGIQGECRGRVGRGRALTALPTQDRLGQAAVGTLADDLVPLAEVEFVGRDAHDRAVAAVIAANRRDLSLVDTVSFDVMRRRGISRAFAVERRFAEAGFGQARSE